MVKSYRARTAKVKSLVFLLLFGYVAGYKTSGDMLSDIRKAYTAIATSEGFYGIIPSGEIFGGLIERGIKKIHRDTFHASCGLGRYALGLLWFRVLSGKSVSDNSFCEFDEPIDANDLETVKRYIDSIKI